MKFTIVLLVAAAVAACEESGEWVGATVVYGTVTNAATGALIQSEIPGVATPYFSGCIHPLGGPEPFVVSNGRYRVLVIGGFGSYPGCAELRFRPPLSAGVDSLIVRKDSLPFDRRGAQNDSVRIDVRLPGR